MGEVTVCDDQRFAVQSRTGPIGWSTQLTYGGNVGVKNSHSEPLKMPEFPPPPLSWNWSEHL